MNATSNNCPRCGEVLATSPGSGVTTCPKCAAAIPPPVPPLIPVPPPLPVARPVGTSGWSWLKIVALILALILGFTVVLVAIAYAGCVYIMKQFN